MDLERGKLLLGIPSSVHGWKEEFFFVRSSEGHPWPFSTLWSRPRKDSFDPPTVEKPYHQEFRRKVELLSAELRNVLSWTAPRTLWWAGLRSTAGKLRW